MDLEPSRTRTRAGSLTARFCRERAGATAVEFGIVAFPFLFLIFAILQIAMVFWTGQVLETAVAAAAREIYTGQFQNNAGNAGKTTAQLLANFKTEVCANMPAFVGSNCMTTIDVDVHNYSDAFSGASAASPVNATTKTYDASSFTYQAVGPKQIAVITASMTFPSFVKFLPSQSGLSSGDYVLIATATFRAEPY